MKFFSNWEGFFFSASGMVMQLENTAGMIKDQNTSEHFLKSSSRFVNHEHPEEALKNKQTKNSIPP